MEKICVFVIYDTIHDELIAMATDLTSARARTHEALDYVNATDEDRTAVNGYTHGILDTSTGIQIVECARDCAIKLANSQWFS